MLRCSDAEGARVPEYRLKLESDNVVVSLLRDEGGSELATVSLSGLVGTYTVVPGGAHVCAGRVIHRRWHTAVVVRL